MSIKKLEHLKDGDKIYLEVTKDGGGDTGYVSYYSNIVIGKKDANNKEVIRFMEFINNK